MNEKTLKRALTVLSLALMVRRRRRTLKRSLPMLKRGAVVLGIAAAVGAVLLRKKRKRGQVEEVSSGSKPIEAVGTQVV
jgi:hypothetical protein